MSAALVLRHLAERRRIVLQMALVAAHPDDETVGAGASLALFDNLTLVHVTDGESRDRGDVRTAGFATSMVYGATRRRELLDALAVAAIAPRLERLDVPDHGVAARMGVLARQLASLFVRSGAKVVMTHAYEGGHPDHDSTCFAVHAACRRLGRQAPQVIEMAGYHAGPRDMTVGTFLPGPEPVIVPLQAAEQDCKRRMLDCFETQRAALIPFGAAWEAFRAAPAYDFAAPPHPGELLYERGRPRLDGAQWRMMAKAAQPAP